MVAWLGHFMDFPYFPEPFRHAFGATPIAALDGVRSGASSLGSCHDS